jgi:hypothetical protein
LEFWNSLCGHVPNDLRTSHWAPPPKDPQHLPIVSPVL